MADPKETIDLVDELKAVINRNLAEDGRLDAYETPEDLGKQPQQYLDITRSSPDDDAEEDEDDVVEPAPKLDLDSEFDWDSYPEMNPSHPSWPQHDTSVFYQPSAINRFLVDYLGLVARVQRVARVLARK